MKLHKGISLRAQWWDYSSIADYHVTICTKDRAHYFGTVEDGKMMLNEEGKIAHGIWLKIPEKFPFVQLDEFIIMPNHIHGLIAFGMSPETPKLETPSVDMKAIGGVTKLDNPMLTENLSRVIRWFKGRTTFEIHKINPQFKWQSRFHDSIIQTKHQFENTENYIRRNPNQ